MRSPTLTAAACLLALAACSKPGPDKAASADGKPPPPAAAPAPPSIGSGAPSVRAGLWEMKVSAEGGTVKGTSRICIDPAVQGVGAAYGQRAPQKDCSQSRWDPAVGGLDFKSVCDVKGAHIVSNGQVRGDLSSHFTVNVDVTTTRDGVTKSSKIASDGTRVGDCPAGMSPGDQQIVVNGRTITVKMPPDV